MIRIWLWLRRLLGLPPKRKLRRAMCMSFQLLPQRPDVLAFYVTDEWLTWAVDFMRQRGLRVERTSWESTTSPTGTLRGGAVTIWLEDERKEGGSR